MRSFPLLGALLLASCGSSSLEGSLKDDQGNAIAEVTLTLSAVDDVGMTCQKFGATTGEDGSFVIEGVCSSQTAYTVKLSDEGLWLPAGGTIEKGAGGPITLEAIRSGGGPGVYFDNGKGEVTAIRTSTDIKEYPVGDTKFNYLKKAKRVQVVGPGEKVLLNGDDNINGFKWHKVTWAAGPMEFKKGTETWSIPEGGGLWVVGGTLTTDSWTPSPPLTPDAGKVTSKEAGDVKLAWIASDALPEGRYAALRPDGRRALIIDMGKEQKEPEAPPPAPEE